MVALYVGEAWAALQHIIEEAPTSLLVGIVVGLLLARVVRSVLIVAALVVLAFAATRLFGMGTPGLG